MKILYLNPHKSDFVFKSVAYNLIKRKNLQKYKYIHDFLKMHETTFLYTSSSFQNFLNKYNLNFIDSLFLYFEKIKFIKINKLNNFYHTNNISKESYDFIFTFGFSIRDLDISQIKYFANKCNFLIIHLSHYHLFAHKLTEWTDINNLVLCADVDLRDYYFYKYFVKTNPKYFVLSFTINDKFYNKNIDRENKVISTGTFHEYEKLFSPSELQKDVVSNIFGSLTLHSERRIIYNFRNQLPKLFTLNSSMGTLKISSFLKFKPNINQKSYFNHDIVTLYNSYNYAFVGEDIAGLPGIGIFESIACGCIPIINQKCYKGTPLEYSKTIINYNNINDLIEIIENIDDYSNLLGKTSDLNNTRDEVIRFFSASYQIKLLEEALAKL